MQETVFKEIRIKLPDDIVDTITSKEIIEMLLDKALSKVEYYKSKCGEFEEKKGLDFVSFKKNVEESEEEVVADWDDLIVWEGYELGYKDWGKKYEELKSCMK